VALFDRDYKTGPFTADLLFPHTWVSHDKIDFDVNNLFI